MCVNSKNHEYSNDMEVIDVKKYETIGKGHVVEIVFEEEPYTIYVNVVVVAADRVDVHRIYTSIFIDVFEGDKRVASNVYGLVDDLNVHAINEANKVELELTGTVLGARLIMYIEKFVHATIEKLKNDDSEYVYV